ncbi:hypothetical protein [Paenibacillus sp. URB8-2]|uniref:hypothetical protein n=1 Tax=Paenibacillus sp. URB8-2 TaxID=2741301 RepID=UPI0015BF7B09|nr:hypothetical protein [Paenibacillus sp. URB8-2]BCG58636.1 hypothetical protein PUR_20610 [Paenibacillus sp. URB8-2]
MTSPWDLRLFHLYADDIEMAPHRFEQTGVKLLTEPAIKIIVEFARMNGREGVAFIFLRMCRYIR